MSDRIRKPVVAGMFYPGDPTELKEYINFMLSQNSVSETFNNIVGIVSPHAGYVYSGTTAAFAYNAVKNLNIKNIYILSPSHREYFDGICIFDGDYYQTPLGNIPVNNELSNKLCANSKHIFKGLNGHRNEHALEVQLPFLQVIFNNFNIIPIVIGNQKKSYLDELAINIKTVWDSNSLIVASSDLSHFHNTETAAKLDGIIINRINNFDFDGLLKDLEYDNCEACGGGAIYLLMKLADLLNINKAKVLKRTDSSLVNKDKHEVVGYLSAVIYGN